MSVSLSYYLQLFELYCVLVSVGPGVDAPEIHKISDLSR
jgi:hypothetical protein